MANQCIVINVKIDKKNIIKQDENKINQTIMGKRTFDETLRLKGKWAIAKLWGKIQLYSFLIDYIQIIFFNFNFLFCYVIN